VAKAWLPCKVATVVWQIMLWQIGNATCGVATVANPKWSLHFSFFIRLFFEAKKTFFLLFCRLKKVKQKRASPGEVHASTARASRSRLCFQPIQNSWRSRSSFYYAF